MAGVLLQPATKGSNTLLAFKMLKTNAMGLNILFLFVSYQYFIFLKN